MNQINVRILAIFSFLVLSPILETSAQNTSIGLRLGSNLANVSGKNTDDNSINLRTNFGALLTYSISSDFGITAEINYSGKGSKNSESDININLNYLEIPIYVNYFLGNPEATFRPKLILGGYLGYLMSAKVARADVSGSYSNSDVGLLLGGGGHYRLKGDNWLNFDVRYNLGLSNITPRLPNDLALRNGVLSLNLAWTFPLGNYEF